MRTAGVRLSPNVQPFIKKQLDGVPEFPGFQGKNITHEKAAHNK